MRSRSNSLEDVTKATADTRKRSEERDEPSGRAERRSRQREPPDDTGTIQRNPKKAKNSACAGATGTGTGTGSSSTSGAAKGGRREKGGDLSRDDLVFLLSLLEGELQVMKRWPGCGSSRRGTGPSRTQSQTQWLVWQRALEKD